MDHDVAARRGSPVHLWIVGILALLWNGFAAFDYLATQLRIEAYLGQLDPAMLAYMDSFPAWSVSAWALGVWGAFVGSILLLMRRRWAIHAFVISLVGLAGTTLYQFALSNGLEVMGPGVIPLNVTIWVIAIALLWYAVRLRSRGVLR